MKNKILLVCKIFLGLLVFLFLNNTLFAQAERVVQEENPVMQENLVQEEKPKPSLGLSVAPGGMMIQNVKLGETYDLYEKTGIALIVENKDKTSHTYMIDTFKPSQVGNKKWLQGYSEIPDPGWFWFDNGEITVEAQSKKKVKMFLKIPDEDKYYNQHWTVSLGISGKPEAGKMLSLAVYPRYQIETEDKTGLEEKPAGLIGLEPGGLVFEDLLLGKKEKKRIAIYNNDKTAHRYMITSSVIEAGPTREQIVVSSGYSWIPDKRWVKPNRKRLKILPGESKDLTISVRIPKAKGHYQKKWEALIFIEPDEGLPGFVRVRIDTQEAQVEI